MRALATEDQIAQAVREATHEALVNAIWEAADAGWPQVDIVAASGLTRERIRQICDSGYREKALERRQKAAGKRDPQTAPAAMRRQAGPARLPSSPALWRVLQDLRAVQALSGRSS